MRVTLSPVVRNFGANDRDALWGASPQPGMAPDVREPAFSPPPAGAPCPTLPDLPDLPDDLAAAALTLQQVDGETLDPALQAWLQPLGGAQSCDQGAGVVAPLDPFCALAPAAPASATGFAGAADPASGSGLFADRDALADLARACLSATPPASPVRSGGLHMAIEAVSASVSAPGADGRAQLHFDPKFDNCDPVVISLGREQALALAHALAGRLAEWGDDSAAGAFDAAV
ncbi:hypothetical protein ACERNI_03455 [Camelimonas sp. ID_303_24]